MSEKFIPLNERFWAAPQLEPEDMGAAARAGVRLIVNNRPDGEALGQPKAEKIASAATDAGLSYVHIPVDSRGIAMSHISALKNALESAEGGKTLAFCRTGTRSTILYAYLQASEGRPPQEIIAEAVAAGYDISGHAPALQALCNGA